MARRILVTYQHDDTDCGPACLATIVKYYGLNISIARIRELAQTARAGTNLLGMIRAAEALGFKTQAGKTSFEEICKLNVPTIVRIKKKDRHHYVVLYSAKKNKAVIGDPAEGIRTVSQAELTALWTGIFLLATPTAKLQETPASQSSARKLLSLLRTNFWLVFEAFLCACFCAVLGLALPVFIQLLVDDVLARRNLVILNQLLIGLAIVLIFRELFGAVKQYLLLKIGQKIDLVVFLEYYRHLLRLPQRFYESHRIGELLARFSDSLKIKNTISNVLITVLLNATVILFSLVLVFYYHTRLALASLACLPLFLVTAICYYQPLRANKRQEMERWAELAGHLVETISGCSTIKLSMAERSARTRTESLLIKASRLNFRGALLSLGSALIGGVISAAGIIVVLWYGGHLVTRGELSIGQLVAFYTVMLGIFASIRELVGVNYSVQDALVAADRVFEILEVSPETIAQDGAVSPPIRGEVELKNVSFEFLPGIKVLNGVSLKIPIGTRLAIVGKSGAGKSTLCKLLAKLYLPSEGQILIDGYDIKDLDTFALRGKISIVGQDSALFSGTVRQNIALSRPEASLEEVVVAARAANIHEFIMELPERYHTLVGEKGMTLSAGQAQRILIARALLMDTRILILDESMNNLDSESEAAIQETLALSLRDRTIIIISHRMSTVRFADQVVILDKGEIIGLGKHEELVRSNEYYLDMLSRQAIL